MQKFMSIEDMKKRNWSIGWSGGKDSTATIIACIKHGIPISQVTYVRMMYSETLPATIPVMTEFVDKMIERLEHQYGIPVNVVKSAPCVEFVCNKVFQRSKVPERNGQRYTVGVLSARGCTFQRAKVKAMRSVASTQNELIGYTIDEPKRYCRLKQPEQESILCTLGITQEKAMDICDRNSMLSPLYKLGIKRDGCWFCPNARDRQISYLKSNYPQLVNIIYDELNEMEDDRLLIGSRTNGWIREYMSDWGIKV